MSELIGRQAVSYRQALLFSFVVLIGLFLTAFTVVEVHQNAVMEARSQFRDASARYINQIASDLGRISATLAQFPGMFLLAGEPAGHSMAAFIDGFSSISRPESITTALVVVAGDETEQRRAMALIEELNGPDVATSTSAKPITPKNSYYLTYIAAREREVTSDGGASLLGADLAELPDYNSLFSSALNSGRLEFALVDDRVSPAASEDARLVFVSPFRTGDGYAFLIEAIHLHDFIDGASATSRLMSDVSFSIARWSNSSEPEIIDTVAVSAGSLTPQGVVPSDGPWTNQVQIPIGDNALMITARASELAYAVEYESVIRAVLIGLAVTAVLGFLAYDQIRRSNRVVEIVNRRTRALKEAHSELENHYKLLQNLNSDVDEARKAAEAANLAKSEFLATMSHELRTPLNAILGFSEILETETLGPIGDIRYVDYARDINSSGRHLLSIINDILDLAKLEAGRVKIEKKPLEPRSLVEGVMALLSHQAEEKGLEFKHEISETIPERIQGDELRLRQVLINLASNSIKFTSTGSVIIRMHVKAFKNGAPGWILEVQDTGIGIPEDKQTLLFDRFTQVDTTHSRRHGGVGLGLAICRELVDRMEGMIGVRSIQNVGTTIRVQLPLDESGADEDDGALI